MYLQKGKKNVAGGGDKTEDRTDLGPQSDYIEGHLPIIDIGLL